MKKVFLFYPPGKIYQRGEDRSQGNVEESTATSIRAPNDMGYAISILSQRGYDVFFKDYQSEGLTFDDLIHDYSNFSPDILGTSVTNSTIFDDLEILKKLYSRHKTAIFIKGAIFFNAPQEVIDQLDLSLINYLIGGEIEFIIGNLVDYHFNSPDKLSSINGIFYKKDGAWEKTSFEEWDVDLDALPFPARDKINNFLYARPDTGEPQATIATSRGCPASCTYCLTPIISGKTVRYRSPDSILTEMREAYFTHNINNFFFKSDTFTINHEWVKELCEKIIASDLHGKIEWVANSRVRPIKQETLTIMRQAGCWLIAFGFESGSEETLRFIKKGATAKDNLNAAQLAKNAGLKVFGFFMVGLPWEKIPHLEDTRKHIFDLNCDFLELHIAVPYYGTELYYQAKNDGLIASSVLGKDYFHESTTGTKFLDISEIVSFRKKLLLQYHLRPSYILTKLRYALFKPRVLLNYFKYGLKLIRNNV